MSETMTKPIVLYGWTTYDASLPASHPPRDGTVILAAIRLGRRAERAICERGRWFWISGPHKNHAFAENTIGQWRVP